LYYLFFVTRRRAVGLTVVGAAIAAVLVLAPAEYFNRMNTIAEYEEDGSAMGRIGAWTAATQMALDYPLGVGAGNFNTAYGRFYRPPDAKAKWVSAHSVYFKVPRSTDSWERPCWCCRSWQTSGTTIVLASSSRISRRCSRSGPDC